MSVSIYNNNSCKYHIGKLDKVVYLVSESAMKNIHIDNGNAYIGGLMEEPMALKVRNIELSDTDELDERYKFAHTLKFSMDGYANYTMFQKKYYAIVKSLDGVYWFVNPMLPCKVSYTYTLDGSGSHSDFTMSIVSNHPTLILEGFNAPTPNVCLGYTHCTFDKLRINENMYSRKNNNVVKYTNDGFKDVTYLKNSAVFTETFDGENISHTLTFNINFDIYKSSWHYNLLEFTENKYATIIRTSCGKYILTGFGFGLNPSFNVNANSDMDIDYIQIQLSDLHDNGDFIWYDEDLTITKSQGTNFVFTSKYDGYECVGESLAKYLLKEEVDKFGNPLGNFLVLEGYENRFPDLNIVGTFTITEEFYDSTCEGLHCRMQSSFPSSTFVFNAVGCKTYYLLCESNWTLSSSSNNITVYPTTGAANTPYEIQICNRRTPTSTEYNATITASYCNKTKQYNVSVIKDDNCFTAGQTFDITANGQYVTIPTQCCVSSVTDSSNVINNVSIQDNCIRVFVPQNNGESARTLTLNVTFCDGGSGNVTINQGVGFERWITESWTCNSGLRCDVQRKYTGLTPYDCNTYTTFTRLANCSASTDCSGVMTRWVDTIETTCSNGKKFIVQEEQTSSDNGINWTPTGNKRIGYEVSDPTGDCEDVPTFEEWRVEPNDYECNDGTKYTKERLYTREEASSEWIETEVTRIGSQVIERDSADCGYVKASSEWFCEKWEVSDGYICEQTTKYAREQRYVRDCANCSNCSAEWIATGVYRRTSTVLETNSIDCGYLKGTDQWSCSEWRDVPNEYFCEGTTKYNKQRLYQRDCTNCSNCSSPWYATYIYRRGGTVLDTNSTDCGYVKGSTEWSCDKWEIDDEYYICEEGTKYAAAQRYVRDCVNCNDCQAEWQPTGVYRRSTTILENNSEDCGFNITITGNCSEYRDEGDTICDGYDEYQYLRKYVRNCNDCSSCSTPWVATNLYKRGTRINTNSFECGFIPVENYTQWLQDSYMCDGYDRYVRLRKYISEDNSLWYETEIFKRGNLIEQKSIRCGFIPVANYTKWEDNGTMCNGFNQYQMLVKYISADNTNWVGTNITKQGNLIESNSFDCGYIPIENFISWEDNGTMCDGYNLYNQQQKYISDDGNRWYETEIMKKGSLIEENSESCHYVSPIQYEYRWILTTATTCDNVTKYYQYKKQRRLQGSSDEWSDIVPTVYSINGEGTLAPQVAEAESEDCGYVPPVEPQYRWVNSGTTCVGIDLYRRQIKQVSLDGGQTWSNVEPATYSATTLIEANSSQCGGGVISYRWQVVSDEYVCVGVDKHEKTQKYFSDDGEVTWQAVTPSEYGTGATIEENSFDCGYMPPVEPQYRWTWSGSSCIGPDLWLMKIKQVSTDNGYTWNNVVPETYSAWTLVQRDSSECIKYRWVNSGTTCIGIDLWQRQIKQVSIDGGQTWSNVEPATYSATTLIESDSSQCVQYRWVNSGTTCVGADLCYLQIKQMSLDDGETWSNVEPNVFRTGDTIESPSMTCNKVTYTLTGGSSGYVVCNSSSEVTSGELPTNRTIATVTIGQCVDTIASSAFTGCRNLTSISIPNNITTIGSYAFSGCSALTSVAIPSGVTLIDSYTFSNCAGLTNVTLPSSITEIKTYAFRSCSSLSSIDIPSGVTTIGSNVFSQCRSLTSITFPDSVTSLGASVLSTCTGLTEVVIGSGITSIGTLAFYLSNHIASVTINATTPPTLGSMAFDSTNNCPIYVPSGSVDAYKAASGWSNYASRIQAIPNT